MKKIELEEWDKLPQQMKNPEVKKYYNILKKKKIQLKRKGYMDIFLAWFLLIFLAPVMIVIACVIYCDSPGEILYRQERVTQYGRIFKIYKFRTMVSKADKLGAPVTAQNDGRITRIGEFLRRYRLDELPQLFNIITGDMTFVGARPEVPHYVERYTPKMWSTLLLPAGLTSLASIKYKDEGKLLENKAVAQIDKIYLDRILPEKMKWNVIYIKEFNFWKDWRIMAYTLLAVLRQP